MDESALTWESVPVEKMDHIFPPDTFVSGRRNMSFFSTFVTYGQGAGVAVGTGVNTELGRIHQLGHNTTAIATPLTKNIASCSKVLTVIILGLAATTFALGLRRGQRTTEVFMATVALAVGAIPEELPAVTMITRCVRQRTLRRISFSLANRLQYLDFRVAHGP
jgi:cation-transporting P-type ATPase F